MATKTDQHVCELSKQLKRLLAENTSLILDKDKEKIRCSLSGHEMPLREDAVRAYISGKKFRKLQADHQYNYSQYEPHIVPSTKKHHEHQLFCMLTLRHINKTPDHVERHVNGGKFKRALARWEDCQKKGLVFKPNRSRRQREESYESGRGVNSKDGDEDDGGDQSDADSLSDLYPAIDFSIEDDEEVSDYDMDTMEEDDPARKESSSKPTVDKRKAENHVIKQKKQKHKHKKQRVG